MVSQKVAEISSLSLYDYANLCGHYLAILRDEKDHESEIAKRGYKEHQLKSVRKKKPSFGSFKLLGLKFTKPLTEFKYLQLHYVLLLFDNYEQGNLPFSGTINDQPAQIIEIFQAIRAIRHEHQKALAQEQEKARKK